LGKVGKGGGEEEREVYDEEGGEDGSVRMRRDKGMEVQG